MKTITIKRRRRMTKHRKGMTKPRKSNRRIKNRKHKTRRQSGGWGWKSFIKAQHNPLKIVFKNDPVLLVRMVTGKNKGIDVKFKRESSGNRVWLIGNTDKTFKELRDGAKDGRYQTFIEVLLIKHKYFNRFETQKEDRDTSIGIILTDEQFCEMFINEPVRDDLNYPGLIEKFKSSGFKCTSSGPSGAVAPRGPSSASAAGTSAVAPSAAPPPSAAFRAAPSGPSGPSAAAPPVTTKFFGGFQEIKKMGLPNVTEQMIAHALNNTNGRVDEAKLILQIAAGTSAAGTSAASGARGGVVSTAPTRATIQDFLNAQAGITENLPERIQPFLTNPCPKFTDALFEINEGQKKTCWIWYILPSSPGQSDISKFFGIGPGANVTPEQYLRDPILGQRYLKMLNAIGAKLQEFMTKTRNHDEVTQFLVNLMGGEIDYEKLMDSLGMFHGSMGVEVDDPIKLLLLHRFPPPPTSAAPPRGPPPGPSDCEIKFVDYYSDPIKVIGNVSYTDFEERIMSKKPLVVINEVCISAANIPFIGDQYNTQIRSRLIDWAEGMIRCNQSQLPSFEKPSYAVLNAQSSRMKLTLSANDHTITKVDGDGWCLYRALTKMYLQKDPDSIIKLRQFAQMITLTIFHTPDYLEYAKNYASNQSNGALSNDSLIDDIIVCGISMEIGIEDMLQLISIPNLDDIHVPCLYPDITWMIGQIAALIIRKNIFVFSNPQNIQLTDRYSGTKSTAPGDQIYLLIDGKHFSVINFKQQPIVSFDQ